MSRTWRRRKDRYGKPIPRTPGSHPPESRRPLPLRLCCDTGAKEGHAPGCNRMPEMCGEKVGFERRTDAMKRALVIADKTDAPWRAYRCPFCELWHLTTLVEGP